MAIETQFDSAYDFSEGLTRVFVKGKVGFIDNTGKMVIDAKYDALTGDFSDGLAPACLHRKCGFIDRTGQMVIDPKFDIVQGFCGGLAQVRTLDGLGYIDRNGVFVWKPKR